MNAGVKRMGPGPALFVLAGVLAGVLVGAPPAQAESLDDRLTPVLRSGCLEGTEALAAWAAATESPEDRRTAEQVLRTCSRVLAETSPTASVPQDDASVNRSGRGTLVIGSTVFGLWTGIALDIIAEIDGERVIAIPPLLGLGAGLGISLYATREGRISKGEAWTIVTGLDYGTYSGLLLAGTIGGEDAKGVVATSLVTGLVGGGLGIGTAAMVSPSAGDAEVVRSGGLWGFATGGLMAAIVQPDDSTAVFGMMLAGMDGGLVGGVLLANNLDVSRSRMLLVDAGSLAGGVVGAGGGLLVLGTPDGDGQARVMAVLTLVGIYAGMGIAAYMTRNMEGESEERREDSRDENREASLALVHRNRAGQWEPGRLLVLPSFSETAGGLRPTGAWVPLVGGAW